MDLQGDHHPIENGVSLLLNAWDLFKRAVLVHSKSIMILVVQSPSPVLLGQDTAERGCATVLQNHDALHWESELRRR
jgi:hypothetical protein